MVQLPNPGKLRPAPPPTVPAVVSVKLEIEDHLEDQHAPPSKRSKASTSFHQVLPYDLLEEPSPLGLRLRKSPSLLDLIQMRLSQPDYAPSLCMTSCDNAEVGGKKDLKSTAVSVTIDKMKASNFPASFLRIGTWECVSRYEGDLVAKCYFAKHKIVWEVLEGGLKSKIEIQWSDITALKATSAENVPDSLDIVLARQPLFFRETNPQPRKHTLWQATSDFTGGQASINRRHFLQCAQGLLCKHFEKLLQCDPRLDALSRQPEIILDSPYFDHRRSVFDDKNESKCHSFDDVKDICGSTMSEFQDIGSSCAGPSISSTSGAGCSVTRAADGLPRDAPSTSVTNTSRITEENTGKGADGSKGSRYLGQLKVPGLRTSMSMCDLVNHIEHCISGQKTLDNPFLSADGSPNKDMLDELAQYLLSDSLTPSAPDEQFLMSRVNSLYCLLQKDNSAAQSLHEGNGYSGWCHDGADVKPDPHPVPASERKPVFNLSTVDEDPDDASGYEQPLPRISRKESFGELLMHLPRIASLPQVLFNITGDPKSKAR